MSSADSIKRNIVKRSSLEDVHRLHRESVTNSGTFSPSGGGKPYPFFVPSTVKSTLGSPVSNSQRAQLPFWLGKDSFSYRSLCHDAHHSIAQLDGVERGDYHECVHWKFLLRYVSCYWILLASIDWIFPQWLALVWWSQHNGSWCWVILLATLCSVLSVRAVSRSLDSKSDRRHASSMEASAPSSHQSSESQKPTAQTQWSTTTLSDSSFSCGQSWISSSSSEVSLCT